MIQFVVLPWVPTDGLVRGMEAVATGAPISVPVGENTLGRMFNVLGEPIDDINRHQKMLTICSDPQKSASI